MVIGQVVIISDDNTPPSRWAIGRIVAVYPGKDNLIRTVDVKCNNSVLKRPIHRLGLLPTLDNEELTNKQVNGGEDVEEK